MLILQCVKQVHSRCQDDDVDLGMKSPDPQDDCAVYVVDINVQWLIIILSLLAVQPQPLA